MGDTIRVVLEARDLNSNSDQSFESWLNEPLASQLVFWGSSQATTGKPKEEFELKKLEELKDRIQTIVIWVLTQGKRSIFENIY